MWIGAQMVCATLSTLSLSCRQCRFGEFCMFAQEILFAGRRIGNDDALETFNVPPGCQCLIAIEGEKLNLGKPDPGAYTHTRRACICAS